ncbi:MAG: helix-turn-helix transcriptional regulator [Candidatus Brennerbacteria bacterium]
MRVKEKTQAVLMRKKGMSMGEIAKKLQVSKASISRWSRGITLSIAQRKKLDTRRRAISIATLRRAAEIKKEEKSAEIKKVRANGKKEVGALSDRDFFIAGLALYWGEGGKGGKAGVEFTNSEPTSIMFVVRWLKKFYGISRKHLKLRVTINRIHEPRIREVLRFWSGLVRVSSSQFSQTSFVNTRQRRLYKNFATHYGTLRLNVKKSTNLHRRIIGSMEVLQTIGK